MKPIAFTVLALLLFAGCAAVNPRATPPAAQPSASITALQRSVVKLLTIRGKEVNEGSGFFVGAPGQLVTNAHVIDGASHIYLFITAPDGGSVTLHQASVAQVDAQNDLAVLQISAENLPPPIPLAKTDAVLMQDVASIGYPGDIDEDYAKSILARRLTPGNTFTEPAVLAYLLPHFTKGHIAKIVPGRFYHTAAIDRGNSGGPLVNHAGELVGINRSATSDPFYPFYFAIPVERLRPLLTK